MLHVFALSCNAWGSGGGGLMGQGCGQRPSGIVVAGLSWVTGVKWCDTGGQDRLAPMWPVVSVPADLCVCACLTWVCSPPCTTINSFLGGSAKGGEKSASGDCISHIITPCLDFSRNRKSSESVTLSLSIRDVFYTHTALTMVPAGWFNDHVAYI